MTARRALVWVLLAAAGHAMAEPKDTIKAHKFEIHPVVYNDNANADPFQPMVPLALADAPHDQKVRIASLHLTSVIVGRTKVAIFNELHGPTYSYILVNGVLLGADHKAIPGIAGVIDPGVLPGEYKVSLRQGADQVHYEVRNIDLMNRKSSRLTRSAVEKAATQNAMRGGAR